MEKPKRASPFQRRGRPRGKPGKRSRIKVVAQRMKEAAPKGTAPSSSPAAPNAERSYHKLSMVSSTLRIVSGIVPFFGTFIPHDPINQHHLGIGVLVVRLIHAGLSLLRTIWDIFSNG